jgi:hypothetical protein
MRIERTDATLLVAEDHQLLAEQLNFLRQIPQFIRRAGRLPIPPQEFSHRAPRLDAGQLIVCRPYADLITSSH